MGKVICHIFLVMLWGSLTREVAAADSCPAVACDCPSLPVESWRQECQRLETELKTSCAANLQKPTGFCGLHGPEAKPLPLATVLDSVELVAQANDVTLLEKQLSTALWSLEDDLSSLQKQIDAGNWGNLSALAKLYDTHADEAFILQRRIVASWLQLNQASQAENVVSGFVKKTRQITEANQKLAKGIWQSAKSSQGDAIKLRQALAQRLLRTAGKLQEQQALALVAIAEQGDAAKAWQEAARVAEFQVQLELAGTQKVEYLTFYRQQAAARWHRASLYWALAKNDNKAQEARRQAREAATQVSAVEELP